MNELPFLEYNQTSGWSGSETSRERAQRHDSDGTTRDVQKLALTMLAILRHEGITWAELANLANVHHGTASSALTNLHKAGRITRLAERRGRSQIYVLPEHVAGRDQKPYKPTKAAQTDFKAIADTVREHFTPYAFKCDCGGLEPSCAAVLTDEVEQIRHWFLKSIVAFIGDGKLEAIMEDKNK